MPKSKGNTSVKSVVDKTKKAVDKTGDFVKENPKTIGYVLVGGVAVYFLYKIFKGINKGIDGVSEAFKAPENDDIKADVKIVDSNVTITEAQATNFAKALLDAFNYTTFFNTPGTDNETVEYVFNQLKTGDDFKMLYKTFNYRRMVYLLGISATSWSDKKLFSEKKDLIAWLKSEISPWFDSSLHKKIKARVESAGMVY